MGQAKETKNNQEIDLELLDYVLDSGMKNYKSVPAYKLIIRKRLISILKLKKE